MKWFLRRKFFFITSMSVFECKLSDNQTSTQQMKSLEENKIEVNRIKQIDDAIKDQLENSLKKSDITPTFNINEAKKRIDKGSYFFILKCNENIIGWSWAKVGTVFFDEFQDTINLKEKHAFAYNSFILKEYRGKGLISLLYQEKLNHLKKDGIVKVWALVHKWNKKSLKSFNKMKWTKLGNYTFLRVLFFNLKFPPDGI